VLDRTHLVVPFLDRKGVGDGEPVPMNLEIGRLTKKKSKYQLAQHEHGQLNRGETAGLTMRGKAEL
jgi:hypothetical protein